jgi:hypothetical protein
VGANIYISLNLLNKKLSNFRIRLPIYIIALLLRLLGLGFRFFGVFLTDRGDGVTEVMVEYVNLF